MPAKKHSVRVSGERVAARFLEAMPKILRGVPGDYDWGFYSNEDPRMHIQTLGKHLDEHKIWLETKGKRVLEPESPIPAKILNAVRKDLTSSKRRKIEAQWTQLMMDKGWLKLEVHGTQAVLTAYPGMPHSFKRTLDLNEYGGPGSHATVHDIKLDRENVSLTLDARKDESEQIYVSLPKVLWQD